MTSFWMTLLFESHTLWLSTCENLILMKYNVARWFDLYTIWIMFCLTKWLKLHVMEGTLNCWEHTDDFNIEKGLYFKLLSIIPIDV
jgi:hypothetical protein